MSKDYIAEQFAWMDELFTHPDNSNLFQDKIQSEIQRELTNRWVKENRLNLLNNLDNKYGEENVLIVIDKIISTNCSRDWKFIGKEKGNSFDNFLKILCEPLKNEGFEFVYEKKDNITKFCVTKCPVYDIAKRFKAEKWLYHLACLTDEPTITGFNSNIKFSRTQTLMQGHPCCDHCYTDLSL